MAHPRPRPLTANRLVLGFGLGSYRFDKYKITKTTAESFSLRMVHAEDDEIKRILAGVFLTRHLINVPTNDMEPDELEIAFRTLATNIKAKVGVITSNDLLKENFPLIHAVGRTSESAPSLLKMNWSKKGNLRLPLVNKGVCFDIPAVSISNP